VRLVDAGTGDEVAVGCRRGVGVRVRVVMSRSGPQSLDTMRVLLTADLVRRVLEQLHGLQVFVTLPGLDQCDHATRRHLDSHFSRLWIATPEPETMAPTRAVEVSVSGAGVTAHQPAGARIAVGPVVLSSPEVAAEVDPLAVRFALTAARYSGPLPLTAAVLDQAQTTIQRWRRRIAAWGEHPSAPMPSDVVASCMAAVDDNLDLPKLISILTGLEDNEAVGPGTKFETFLYFDRILACDLARNLGTAGPAEADPAV
jgi:hypothetical protein